MGETDAAVEWLEKSIEERNGELVFLDVTMKSESRKIWRESFRTDPRVQKLIARAGLSI